MSFVHEDPEFSDLLRIVSRERGLAVSLVEKDYWVTHVLWALHETGLEISFKGGTSLSKGFELIWRFSEDLDLQIDAGAVEGLPEVQSWKSKNRGPIEKRREFFERLTIVLKIPSARVTLDERSLGEESRGANYQVQYPGEFLQDLGEPFRPFVLLEVGRARVHPFVERPLSSFVHDRLEADGELDDYEPNRPACVRCLHPLVTLIEKIDGIARRYETGDPGAFIRHYEDAARIIENESRLPSLEGSLEHLVGTLLKDKTIRLLPLPEDPAFALSNATRRDGLQRAHEAIGPMFWGDRLTLAQSAELIQDWLAKIERPDA